MVHTFQCINMECDWFQKPRRVALKYLDQGLYFDAPVRCECGYFVCTTQEIEKWKSG